MAKLAPQVMKMRARGMTVKEIAKKLRRSERYIYAVMRWANDSGDRVVIEIPDPKPTDALAPEVRGLLEMTPDAFEGFFNRYSGRILAPIHKQWVKDALSSKRVLINCPPRHAKSTIFSVWFPIWLVCMDRDVQILICSQTERLAMKFSNEIAAQLTYNLKLIQDFGRFKPEMGDWPWRPGDGELMVEGRRREVKSGDMTIQIRGSGQQILGMEANWVIADDVVSRENARTPQQREAISEWFHGDVMSRLEPGGVAVVIGQRLHLYDLYGELAREKVPGTDQLRWLHINYPAVLDWEEKKVLWPDRWPWAEIMEKYVDLGSSRFEAMYQQNPLPEGEALAQRRWIYGGGDAPGCLDLDRVVGQGAKGVSRPVRVISLDPSPTRYAGLIVAELDWDPQMFNATILEVRREKMQVRDMLSHVERCVDWYEPHYFVFEKNAAQRWLLQDPTMEALRRRIQVIPHETGRNKGDPVLGIESLSVDFEFGRIRLPYGDAESKQMSELLIQEALTYPQGQTDDLLMALWFIKFNYSRLVPRGLYMPSAMGGGPGWKVPPRLRDGWRWFKRSA